MAESSVNACPRCKRMIEAKDYLRHPLGSVMPTIKCPCGYRGLPISLNIDEYVEWKKGKEGDTTD